MRGTALLITALCLSALAASCTPNQNGPAGQNSNQQMSQNPYQPTPYVKLKHPEWTKNAVIYQINTRQFTHEGTFRAAEKHLPRLKELGVDILWLMPVHQIGEKNRKGSLGSPYSVKDYYGVNPEFGTLEDLKHFVAPRTSRACTSSSTGSPTTPPGTTSSSSEHPEWYERDWKGDFRPTPWWDWSDIIDLDYQHEGLRRYMTDAHEILGAAKRTSTATAATWRASCRSTSGTTRAGSSTPSSPSSCWPSGSRGTCTPRRST